MDFSFKRNFKSKWRFNPNYIDEIEQSAISFADEYLVSSFYMTTDTWEHKPIFDRKVIVNTDGVEIIPVIEIGSEYYDPGKIWGYLNKGTNERWAMLSKNWVSKTQPGRLSSGYGRGHVWLRGRKAMEERGFTPFSGIEAREWDSIIYNMLLNPFKKYMSNSHKFLTRMVDTGDM